jgi:hypothetical protein
MHVAGWLGSLAIMAATGCGQFPICPPDCAANPSARMRQLLNEDEESGIERLVEEEWLRMWFNDESVQLNPQRIHGGIQ